MYGCGLDTAVYGSLMTQTSAVQRHAQHLVHHQPAHWHPNLRTVPARSRRVGLCVADRLTSFQGAHYLRASPLCDDARI